MFTLSLVFAMFALLTGVEGRGIGESLLIRGPTRRLSRPHAELKRDAAQTTEDARSGFFYYPLPGDGLEKREQQGGWQRGKRDVRHSARDRAISKDQKSGFFYYPGSPGNRRSSLSNRRKPGTQLLQKKVTRRHRG